jgi:glycine cleavage system H protein
MELAMTTNPDDALQLTVDKFIFRFPTVLKYSDAGLWIKQEDGLFRIGISDFIQQHNGDIAFVNLPPAETMLNAGDELAAIETVKVNISFPSPIKGRIVETNSFLIESPELINQEPYGRGWMVVIQPEDFQKDLGNFLAAEAYVELAKRQADAERTH